MFSIDATIFEAICFNEAERISGGSFNFPGAQDTRFFANALTKLHDIVQQENVAKL